MKRKRGGSRTVTAEPANRSPAQEAGVVLQAPREESSGGSGGRDAIKATLTLECVDAYVKYRSFDVIGYGAYRKYVNAGKEAGEAWATETLAQIARFNSAIAVVQRLVDDLQSGYNQAGLYQVCQAVIENNTPPMDQATVIAECVVTKKAQCSCIVLRCKGRGAFSITVQSRFGHFILMLWTVFKVDLIIKTTTREFLESTEKCEELSMRDLCAAYVKKHRKLSTGILHAVQHVTQSLYEALAGS